ncbi:MAG TPA: hypothetical protein VG871_18150 [Vicinamibacterales bacterium]|nr:hypothetical protein [Vicinamibacterales bacterium]
MRGLSRSVTPLAVVVVLGLGASAFAQTRPASPKPEAKALPHTPWGDLDLNGTYNNSNESGIPMERPAELAGKTLDQVTPAELAKLLVQRHERTDKTAVTIGGTAENDTGAGPSHWYENYNAKNSRAWMISDPPDGQRPALTKEAMDRAAAARRARRGGDGYYNGPFDGPEDLTLYVRCITRGLPGSMMPAIYGNSYRIVQGPGWVAITYEMVHETRLIPLDNRPHIASDLREDMGDARGHFEGDTLVVETTNFNERSAYGGASEHLKTTERFKLLPNHNIDWSITFDDPHTWVRPWTFGMLLTRDDKEPVFEYACHEGNEGIQGILKAARAAEHDAAGGKSVE